MPQAGFTPIITYHSTTGAAVPNAATLSPGELAVNIADMKLYAENSSGTVTLLASADAAAGNFTTVDATNLEVTNIKAKDGTAAATIADSTGVVTVSTQLNVDNLRLDGNTMSSTNTDGNIAITPNGTGEVDISKVDIDAGAIDGTTIGASSAAAATFTDVTLNAQGDVRFADSDSSNWVAFQGPATVASNITWTLPNADGTNGQVLSTNGSGTLSWATGGGGSLSGETNSASPFETSLGSGAGAVNTGVNNVFVGFEAGNDNTSGTNNTALGYQALDVNTTGASNTAVGSGALGLNVVGINNTVVGHAGFANSTASNNTGLGYGAGNATTTGTCNIAVGGLALGYAVFESNTTGSNNIVMGAGALARNTTANNNVAIGHLALHLNTTGANNTAVGFQALDANTTGIRNVAVGVDALGANTTGQGNVSIGWEAGKGVTTGNDNVFIGINANTEATTGTNNIGVGSANGGDRIFALTTESNRAIFGNNGITNAYVKVAFTVTSDARDKTSIESVPHGLSFVQQLNPVSYRWKTSREDDTPHGNKRYGFLAQDILAIEGDDPVIIDNEQPDNLKYQGESLVPVLVNAIKELSAKVEALEAQLKGN
jgi:hypothetical protein